MEVVEGSNTRKPGGLQHEEQLTTSARSESVEVKEEPKKGMSLDPHHEEPATVQTRSKSTAVKDESKKRKSLEPQRDDEAAKRLKPNGQHGKEAQKTQGSLFGPQATSESAGMQAADLRDSTEAGAEVGEDATQSQGKRPGNGAGRDGQRKEQDSGAGINTAHQYQHEGPASRSRQSAPSEAQDGTDDDVIVVAGVKDTQSTAAQSAKANSGKDEMKPQTTVEDEEEESDFVPRQELKELKEKANRRIAVNLEKVNNFAKQVQDLTRENHALSKKNEELKEDRNIWFTNCREVEQDLQQWKASKKSFEKEMRKELKELDQEERKADMDRIRSQNKKDLQLKQQKHDLELKQMRQKMEDANEDIKEEKKKAAALMQEAKKKFRESRVETNSVIKEREEQIKDKDKEIYRLGVKVDSARTDNNSLKEELKRVKREREIAKGAADSQLSQREQLEDQLVEKKSEVMRKDQEIKDIKADFKEILKKEQEKSALFYKNNGEMSQQVANKRLAIVDLNRANEKIVARNMALGKNQEAHEAEIAMLKEEASKTEVQQKASSSRIEALEKELESYKEEIEMLKETARAKTQPTPPSPTAIPQASPVPALNDSSSHASPGPEVPTSSPEAATTPSMEEHKSGWHSLPPNPKVNFAPSPQESTPVSNTENMTDQAFDSDGAAKEATPPAQDSTTSITSENVAVPSLSSNNNMTAAEATPPEPFSSNITKEVTPPTAFADTTIDETAPPSAPFNVSTAVDEPNKPAEQNEAFQDPEAQILQVDRDVTMNEDVASAGEDQVV